MSCSIFHDDIDCVCMFSRAREAFRSIKVVVLVVVAVVDEVVMNRLQRLNKQLRWLS